MADFNEASYQKKDVKKRTFSKKSKGDDEILKKKSRIDIDDISTITVTDGDDSPVPLLTKEEPLSQKRGGGIVLFEQSTSSVNGKDTLSSRLYELQSNTSKHFCDSNLDDSDEHDDSSENLAFGLPPTNENETTPNDDCTSAEDEKPDSFEAFDFDSGMETSADFFLPLLPEYVDKKVDDALPKHTLDMDLKKAQAEVLADVHKALQCQNSLMTVNCWNPLPFTARQRIDLINPLVTYGPRTSEKCQLIVCEQDAELRNIENARERFEQLIKYESLSYLPAVINVDESCQQLDSTCSKAYEHDIRNQPIDDEDLVKRNNLLIATKSCMVKEQVKKTEENRIKLFTQLGNSFNEERKIQENWIRRFSHLDNSSKDQQIAQENWIMENSVKEEQKTQENFNNYLLLNEKPVKDEQFMDYDTHAV